MPQLHLTKSKYLAGLQCSKRLWLQCRRPKLAMPPDAATRALFAMGAEVGRRAHRLFPGGVLVREGPAQHARAVRRTRELLAEVAVPAIFEAAFEYAGVRVRVDVLKRLGDARVGLREVKSSTQLKAEHVEDLAVQRFVLEGSGLEVESTELVHVNREYVRGEGEIEWAHFFERRECDEEVEVALAELPGRVEAMTSVIAQRDPPRVEPGPHCGRPYACEFWDHCTRRKPSDWIFFLPRLRPTRFQDLRQSGYERIRDIPSRVGLTSLQTRVREVICSGRPFVSEGLGGALQSLEGAAWFLDFETMNPAIPPYVGTRPFEVIPFQWSLHRLGSDGRLEHREFLADGRSDPRRALAQSLRDALAADEAPIAVYSSYERTQLGALARRFPDLAGSLGRIAGRLVDLLPVVRVHVYHAAFRGSFSLKAVAPALARGFDYGDLGEVREGSAASAAFARIACGQTQPDEEAQLRRDLLAYCAHDTLALVELYRALRKLAG
jgi:predicted RecB family nuclease